MQDPGQTSKLVQTSSNRRPWIELRLRKHGDYQRVYAATRKQHGSNLSYFVAPRVDGGQGVRVGLTVGKVLGIAVERNRIKRRLRELVRRFAPLVSADLDIILHPRRTVLTLEFARLETEVERIFQAIAAGGTRVSPSNPSSPSRETHRVPSARIGSKQ